MKKYGDYFYKKKNKQDIRVVDLKTKQGDTPLMIAIEFGRYELFKYLLV